MGAIGGPQCADIRGKKISIIMALQCIYLDLIYAAFSRLTFLHIKPTNLSVGDQ